MQTHRAESTRCLIGLHLFYISISLSSYTLGLQDLNMLEHTHIKISSSIITIMSFNIKKLQFYSFHIVDGFILLMTLMVFINMHLLQCIVSMQV